MLRFLSAISFVLIGFLGAWAFWLEPSSLSIVRYSLTLQAKNNLEDLRVAVISDVHIGRYYGDEKRLEKIVETINSEGPDLVLFLGDFVAQKNSEAFLKAAHVLKNIHSRVGVFSVLGNHDWWAGKEPIVAALQENNVVMLDNKAIEIDWQGGRFSLAGFGDFWEDSEGKQFADSFKKNELPVIALTHNPDLFPHINSSVTLVFAGHTHGGQVYFPGVGAPIVPSEFGSRYRYGLIHENGHSLLVTSGTGNSMLPVRFRVPPEVVFVDLSFRK